MATELASAPQPQYPSGTIECCVCHIAIGFNPEIKGISSGYCPACGQIALAEVEAWIAQQAAKLQAEFTQALRAEFIEAKAAFAARVGEAVR